MTTERFDIAVVGGGMVGLTLALGLEGVGARVAVIERESLKDMAEASFDGRGSAIAAGSQRILDGTGLWELLQADAEPISEIRVADGPSQLFLHYDHREVGEGPLGWIVENAHIRRAFAQAVVSSGDCFRKHALSMHGLKHDRPRSNWRMVGLSIPCSPLPQTGVNPPFANWRVSTLCVGLTRRPASSAL